MLVLTATLPYAYIPYYIVVINHIKKLVIVMIVKKFAETVNYFSLGNSDCSRHKSGNHSSNSGGGCGSRSSRSKSRCRSSNSKYLSLTADYIISMYS